MHILFISQYFPPEMGAPAARVHELSRRWVTQGHRVTVLTGFPNHPTGVIPPEYGGRLLAREHRDGIEVIRSYLYAAPNRGILRRSLSYVSFMLSVVLLGPFVTPRPDVVIATSPQFLVGIAGWILARLKRRPFVLEIRDLWPDSIVAVGALAESSLGVRLLRRLERFLYRRADRIVVVTRSFVRELTERGVPAGRIEVFTNGVDVGFFRAPMDRDQERARLGFEGKFVSVYVGTVGMAHGLETILGAAELLRTAAPDARFAVVGEGARRREVEDEAVRRGLENVAFLGQRPRGEIPAILRAADAALVLLRDTPLFRTVLPSKMFEAMGAGVPVILGVDGEAAEVLRESGGGVAIRPENARDLARAILELRGDPARAGEIGFRGREFAASRYDRDVIADAYVGWLGREFSAAGRPRLTS